MKKHIFLAFCIGIFLAACSAKDSEELYNLNATQWYKQIIKDLQDKD